MLQTSGSLFLEDSFSACHVEQPCVHTTGLWTAFLPVTFSEMGWSFYHLGSCREQKQLPRCWGPSAPVQVIQTCAQSSDLWVNNHLHIDIHTHTVYSV